MTAVKEPRVTNRDIVNDVFTDYGIQLPYYKAWHGKEVACKDLHGDESLSFDNLRWYADAVIATNPGSYVELECISDDHRFRRSFVCFGASLIDAAAYGLRIEYYTKSLAHMRGYSEQAVKWVEDSNPNHWANAFFQEKDMGKYLYRQAYVAAILPIVVFRGQRGKHSSFSTSKDLRNIFTSKPWDLTLFEIP
ncbi:hypothetical protein QJS10_CPA08g00881 [Acorus calamus]|uniref:Uncharacterized protein n=1 Tax=Acorus calamus TaxID=4465 RepID=A0AAV9EA29_ACOCL|nr:hypothetical protein QJS10_CPA08g00881 [Acorus calamus]